MGSVGWQVWGIGGVPRVRWKAFEGVFSVETRGYYRMSLWDKLLVGFSRHVPESNSGVVSEWCVGTGNWQKAGPADRGDVYTIAGLWGDGLPEHDTSSAVRC